MLLYMAVILVSWGSGLVSALFVVIVTVIVVVVVFIDALWSFEASFGEEASIKDGNLAGI